jgi:hypothetical protein
MDRLTGTSRQLNSPAIYLFPKGAGMAINTRKGKRVGIVKNRYQKQNPAQDSGTSTTSRGNYFGTKKTADGDRMPANYFSVADQLPSAETW